VKVCFATAKDYAWSETLRVELVSLAKLDRVGEHSVISDPEEADIVLFIDPHQRLDDWSAKAIRKHPLVRRYPEKVCVYDERDTPIDSLPGLYVAMPQSRFDPSRQRATAYYRLITETRAFRAVAPDLLFSFRGRRGARVRDVLFGTSHAHALIEDTSQHDFFTQASDTLERAKARYCEALARSKFVLCPRGAGTSSFRLFESLAAGRVPVILSDDWVEPAGIDWSGCSVRIPEAEADSVGSRLEELEKDWPRMSIAARAVYDDWFAPEVWFHRAAQQCLELQAAGARGLARQWTSRYYWLGAARHAKHLTSSRKAP
jgi:hypothetical protein